MRRSRTSTTRATPVRASGDHDRSGELFGLTPATLLDGKLNDENGEHEGNDRQLEPHNVLGAVAKPEPSCTFECPKAVRRHGDRHGQHADTLKNAAGYAASADRCSPPRSFSTACSTLRFPATISREPNEATIRNQGEIVTWATAPPATARKANPAATQASSTNGTRLRVTE